MSERIKAVVNELEQVTADARAEFGMLSAKQLNWQRSESEWSVAQCFEHLIVTNELYFPNIQKVIDGQHRNNFLSKVPFATDLIAFAMKNSLNPTQSRKMKTFKMFQPAESRASDTSIKDFAANLKKLADLAVAAQSLDVHRIKIAEPLSTALNLRLVDAFEILTMHCRRHFNQAKRVVNEGGFPA